MEDKEGLLVQIAYANYCPISGVHYYGVEPMSASVAIQPLDAAKSLGLYLEWKVSNLKMNKVLYMAQLLYMGKNGVRLIDADFQAWKYGPVIPEVYYRLREFGTDDIKETALSDSRAAEGEQAEFFKVVAETFADFPPSKLISMTHHPEGAWAKVYSPADRDAIISDESIKKEYDWLYRNGGQKHKEAHSGGE